MEKKHLHKLAVAILIVYIGVIFCITLLFRTSDENYQHNFKLFWSYSSFIDGNWSLITQIILNILLFIPFGFLLTICLKGSKFKAFFMTMLIACLFSTFIEAAQLVFKLGLAEFDDVFDNTLGAAIGAGIALIFKE